MAHQHASQERFVAVHLDSQAKRLQRGEPILENLEPASEPALQGPILHHWRGTAYAAGATAADFEHLIADFDAYPEHFSNQVLYAHVLNRRGDRMQGSMRIRQQHGLTVVLDATSLRDRLVRFHLSNGAISLFGNLLLMRLLVQGAHLGIVSSNCIAICSCSLINFCLSDRWAFAARSQWSERS